VGRALDVVITNKAAALAAEALGVTREQARAWLAAAALWVVAWLALE